MGVADTGISRNRIKGCFGNKAAFFVFGKLFVSSMINFANYSHCHNLWFLLMEGAAGMTCDGLVSVVWE
ncbi:MAG TPA: hypothetical protein DEF21_07305 [Thalassospira lucentensis]|uniref:Uncharacterized protein n=1 Tax=Thalassospira lucentensis TaxID=168935 RepID=A0A358HR90_9PROT|nr:hypothetical protein [Thalassospira lucentensis]HCW67931.1 hypothetical protein [Thalassospira lucentensis]